MEQGVEKTGVPSPWRAVCAPGETESCFLAMNIQVSLDKLELRQQE